MPELISIVIPTLNERKNIAKAIHGINKVLKGYNYEIIVIDGHSSDNTDTIAKKEGAIVIYDNTGKGSALKKGFDLAKGSIIISMDADLSNEPRELKILIAGINAGYDICMGSRFLLGGGSDDMPLLRRFGNKIFVIMVNVLYGSKYTDLCYGYRSFSKNAINRMHLNEHGFGIETEINILAKKLNMRVLEVPSYEKKRESGLGKLRSLNDGYKILKTIILNKFN